MRASAFIFVDDLRLTKPTLLLTNMIIVHQTLHELGATNVDSVDQDNDTPCMLACYNGDVESLKVLHAIKADLDFCGSFGTALHRAVDAGHCEMIKVMLRPQHPA